MKKAKPRKLRLVRETLLQEEELHGVDGGIPKTAICVPTGTATDCRCL